MSVPRLRIEEMLRSGVSSHAIAEKLHVSSRTVAKIRDEIGIASQTAGAPAKYVPGRDNLLPRTPKQQEIAALWESGLTQAEIAARVGSLADTVCTHLSRMRMQAQQAALIAGPKKPPPLVSSWTPIATRPRVPVGETHRWTPVEGAPLSDADARGLAWRGLITMATRYEGDRAVLVVRGLT